VKTALGEDAIIIDTRQVGGGLWSRPDRDHRLERGALPRRRRAAAADRGVQVELGALRRLVEELRMRIPAPSSPRVVVPVTMLYRRLCSGAWSPRPPSSS